MPESLYRLQSRIKEHVLKFFVRLANPGSIYLEIRSGRYLNTTENNAVKLVKNLTYFPKIKSNEERFIVRIYSLASFFGVGLTRLLSKSATTGEPYI
jgi:hypothetical protein